MSNTPTYLNPKNDVVFKCLFGARGNEKITKDFLEHVIGEKIEEITTDWKLELDKRAVDDKQMVRDLVAKDENLKKYIIEMQRRALNYLPSRFVGYTSKTYVADIRVAQDYNKLQKTVLIVIMEEDFKGIENLEEYHTIWKYTEQKHREVTFENTTEIHILELNKYERQKKRTKKIDPWLEFFIAPYGKEVEKMARTMEQLQAAVDQLNLLSADEEVRRLADAQDFARLDRNSELREERENARAEGRTEQTKKIAKEMIIAGMKKNTIMQITKLTKEEIEQIFNECSKS